MWDFISSWMNLAYLTQQDIEKLPVCRFEGTIGSNVVSSRVIPKEKP